MRKSNAWQLVAVVLLLLLALFVALDIDHPDWAEDLLFWQPTGQREIALYTGIDIHSGRQILLAADLAAGQKPEAASLEATRAMVEKRASSLALTGPEVKIQDERHILVRLPEVRETLQVTDTIQATGLVELFDTGRQDPGNLFGATIETSLDAPPAEGPAEGPAETLTTTTAITPSAPTGPVFETVLSGEDLALIALVPSQTGNTKYDLAFVLTPQAADALAAYAATHVGQSLGVALDKKVIAGASLPRELETKDAQGNPVPLNVPAFIEEENAAKISILFSQGPLPVPLKVENYGSVEPTLGQRAVQRSERAVVIALAAVLLFLLLNYRLPGALAALMLLFFFLLNFAIYKLIPLPLTLPGISGLATAAFLALGGQIAILERLRAETRAGVLPYKAANQSLEHARSSVRATHLGLFLIALALWYVGANLANEAIKWMGVMLSVGVPISFFVATIVTRAFVLSIFDTAEKWLSERGWLLS